MAQVDYKELKKGGFMKQVQKDRFSLRLGIVGGQIDSEKLKKIYEVSTKYGQGYVHLTSRQGIEIPFIKLEDVEAVKKELEEAGISPGTCGPRVRTITACQGMKICSSGLIDTTELALEFDERYHGRDLPHKFKLGITGCKNNCLKAEENDLGVKGGILPSWNSSACSFCGLCKEVCPTKAIGSIDRKEKDIIFEEDKCNYCGRCVKVCPTSAWEGKNGFVLYFGGTFGNRLSFGRQLLPILFSKEEVFTVVDKTLEFFKNNGKAGERFGVTLDRVGWDLLEKKLKEGLKNE
ncbi:MAG TPA: 4Fe-4S binding protein [Clostridiaceae bacterium]